MSKPFNPLFDKKRETVATLFDEKNFVTASTQTTPKSPITQKPMTKAFCGDIPVYVDLETRVVLPVKE